MTTEVLLMSDITDLGVEGDVVKVADGYARNYLLPKKLAAPVTAATHRQLAKMREQRQAANAAALADAQKLADRLSGVSVTIPVKTGDDDKLFGSVTVADIVTALQAQEVELDRQVLALENPIKKLGVFDVPVRLHPDVEAAIKVWVVEE